MLSEDWLTAVMETNFQPSFPALAISLGTSFTQAESVLYSHMAAEECEVAHPEVSMDALHRAVMSIAFILKV